MKCATGDGTAMANAEIVPAEAEVIRRIFRRYAAEVSPKALTKRPALPHGALVEWKSASCFPDAIALSRCAATRFISSGSPDPVAMKTVTKSA